jgi:hypothetical protein
LKKIFAAISTILGLITFVLLIISLIQKGKGVSFATFFLWAILSAINAVSTIKRRGNYLLPATYTFGNLVVALVLLFEERYGWGGFEWITLFLVALCMIIYRYSTLRKAIVASTLATVIASLPQLKISFETPWEVSIPIWSGFLLANIFSVLAGKEWTIQERFYSFGRSINCGLIIVLAIIKLMWP